ncbi:MAG: aldehyde dehydrogenase family protein, partial [Pseudomonadota bacterium]
MRTLTTFYIDGAFREPDGKERLDVINPATEEKAGEIALGNAADIDRAVRAAAAAFPAYAATSAADRIALLKAAASIYEKRLPDMAAAITEEMGAPTWLAKDYQAPIGLGHLKTAARALADFEFDMPRGKTLVTKEPVGVCGFITPWNWPSNQIAAKVAPAL